MNTFYLRKNINITNTLCHKCVNCKQDKKLFIVRTDSCASDWFQTLLKYFKPNDLKYVNVNIYKHIEYKFYFLIDARIHRCKYMYMYIFCRNISKIASETKTKKKKITVQKPMIEKINS